MYVRSDVCVVVLVQLSNVKMDEIRSNWHMFTVVVRTCAYVSTPYVMCMCAYVFFWCTL